MPPGDAQEPARRTARVLILHPGAMGAALGAELVRAGSSVGWVPGGRSPLTRDRASAAGMRPLRSLPEAAAWAEAVFCVCPPHAALEVAGEVAATRFEGCYADLNATSPRRLAEIASRLSPGGASVLDGCLIGPPPRGRDTVRLYLSGDADAIGSLRSLFVRTRVRTTDLHREQGRASALKMAYALHRKGSLALAGLAAAIAEGCGVGAALEGEWRRPPPPPSTPELQRAASAAWRWSGEMAEIAATCTDAGLDPALPEAAQNLLERWDARRDQGDAPRAELLADLRRQPARP